MRELPADETRRRLRRALAQWRHWQVAAPLPHPPEIIEVLSGGISNYSVLVQAGPRFVVRQDGLRPAGLGLTRQAEWRALQAAAARGLAPTPRYFNPDLGCLVCDYLPPEEGIDDLAATARLLRGIHSLPAMHHRLDPRERIRHYEKTLAHRGIALPPDLAGCRAEVLGLTRTVAGRYSVLCHNDLLRSNRLHSGGRLWALDWEYCAMGDPWFDLAVVAAGDALDGAGRETLLRAYLGHAPGPADWRQLHEQCCVYRFIELLWYLAAERECNPRGLLGELRRELRALEKRD